MENNNKNNLKKGALALLIFGVAGVASHYMNRVDDYRIVCQGEPSNQHIRVFEGFDKNNDGSLDNLIVTFEGPDPFNQNILGLLKKEHFKLDDDNKYVMQQVQDAFNTYKENASGSLLNPANQQAMRNACKEMNAAYKKF